MRFRLTLMAPVAVVLALVTLLVAGCALPWPGRARPTVDPAYRLWQDGLQPAAHADLLNADAMPLYRLTLRIDPEARQVNGRARVRVPNPTDAPLSEIFFRLYPNIRQYAGQMVINGVTVNGQAAGLSTAAQNTALQIVLPRPVEAGEAADVEIAYTVDAPARDEGYTLFGQGENILSLPVAYPVLALRRDGAWQLDTAPSYADAAYSEASLYVVTATVPSGVTIVPSGRVVSTTEQADGTTVWVMASGPAREFALLLSPYYQVATTVAYSTTVRSYFLPSDQQAGLAALEYAAASLRIYTDRFGLYPYTELHVAEAPLTYRGQEYPALNLLGIDLYRGERGPLEFLTAHEVAHQWWYNLVGNDPYHLPWLDEGLAEFSTFLYYEARFGRDAAERLRERRWQTPLLFARQNGLDVRVGQSVAAFSPNNYETMVYAKAALFFDALRERVGFSAFDAITRAYARANRWQIIDADALLEAIRATTRLDLTPLYQEWILGGEATEEAN